MAVDHIHFDPNNVAGQQRHPESWTAGRVRQLAAQLVEHGRALGRVEAARLLCGQRKGRISLILDMATRAMPRPTDEATLEDWRDGRRLLFSALSEWHDDEVREAQLGALNPPPPGDAGKLLDQLLALTEQQRRVARRTGDAVRRTGAWLHTAADFIASVLVALRDTREELQSIRREREAG